jgi:hypothetical protein
MTDTPTFGRYTELPIEQMTPEQQAGRAAADDEFLRRAGKRRGHAAALGSPPAIE